jgi:pimeloyl-ACP methyl ester carboxylesterase
MAPTAVDKLTPADPRVQHHTVIIPNTTRTYGYLLANPTIPPTGTALLVHGFPDLSFGWRYQVPFLLARGLRVIVPDLPGYGRTDAPQELGAYSYKSVVEDLVQVVKHVLREAGEDEEERIVLGGHDWYVWILILFFIYLGNWCCWWWN